MPIYEYQCPKCGRTFEEWVKMADAHGEEPCPDCGTSSPKLISHTSFVLKGGGWYVTDYGYRKGVKEDGSADTAKETSGKAPETTSSGESSSTAQSKDTSQAKPKQESPKPKTLPNKSQAKPQAKQASA